MIKKAQYADLTKTAASALAEPFDGVIRLEPEGEAPVWLDGRAAPPQALSTCPSDAQQAPLCVWRGSLDNLYRIFEDGEKLLANAYVSGRLSIAGDMSIMARLRLKTDWQRD